MGPRAVVVGAGIAGISAAHALTRSGFAVRLLEREPKLRTGGTGLSLWPNAIRALGELSLDDAILDCGHAISDGATLAPSGEVIARMPLDRIAARFGPLISVHRGELLESLFVRVGLEVEFGVTVAGKEGALYVGSERLDADLIVGADGIGSVVRELIAPGFGPRPAGYSAWRGIAHTGGLTPSFASETFGRGKRFGLVPLRDERTYWFAVLSGSGGADLEHEFAGWHDPVAAVLAATPSTERLFLPIEDLAPLPRWHRDNVVLIGDASHAMTPNMGQGAAQALLDVVALRNVLASRRASVGSPSALADALRTYERSRKRHAERIVRRSRAIGRLAQTANPLAASLRDSLTRRTPASLMAHQMGRVLC